MEKVRGSLKIKMKPDFRALASCWNSSKVKAIGLAERGVTVTALVCSIKSYDNRTSLQLRVTDDQRGLLPMFGQEPVTISLPSSSVLSQLEPMDLVVLEGCHEKMIDDGRVFLNAKTVRVHMPWRQVVADREIMSKELVPMPLPDKEGVGRPFIIYSGSLSSPLLYETVPGLHRKVEWDTTSVTFVNKKTKATERRLMVIFEQRQWRTITEANAEVKPLFMRMPIWDRSCRQLFSSGDLNKWTAIIRANPIPFYAVVYVDGKHTTADSVSLSTLAVHWDLRTYIELSCLELTAEQTQTALGSASSSSNSSSTKDADGLVNVTDTGVIPQGKEWHYYAMTANNAKEADELEEPMVLFAAFTAVAAAAAKKPVTKKAKKDE
jgi:hypothetical protein